MIVVKVPGGIKKEVSVAETLTLEWKPMTILQWLGQLGIEEKQVGAVLVNGKPKKMSHTLEDGDEVQILPVLSGG
ncbi:MoaD/ThiS family protein [Acidaminobacter sp.]|uniref:MoaD/ThiS family protein n=1 Tax=Acidaminobacter sp. TaxID=1872102 RepID=UPI00137F7EA5|nr:MoaD/ThiS family protein [Acidaminobacter sp.]MDK9710718.1 MoaD/ThiS family protein [Acidaminobacter sp.]MZQ97421.1 TGS domain-containing protein [Acidaminobacter sp.]